jgi:hypothetical protein
MLSSYVHWSDGVGGGPMDLEWRLNIAHTDKNGFHLGIVLYRRFRIFTAYT